MPRIKKVKTLSYLSIALIIYIAYKTFFKYPSLSCYFDQETPHLVNPLKNLTNLDQNACQIGQKFCIEKIPAVNIQMLDAYHKMDFNHKLNPEWEEGWCVKYNPNTWSNENKLHVFVVPHSHNDPGWLRTFDEYYHYATRHILTNMLTNLRNHKEMRFVWAEISFFSRWYEGLNENDQRRVKLFLKNKQLEIVTGGWVMPDEANSHWYSLLIQLHEGQSWLKTHLNYTPVSAWAIDPFGHSPTMTNLLELSGFKNMVIGRTHYIVKKHFAMHKLLEFNWKQLWDASNDDSSQILTHMLPFSSYAIHYSHGPSKAVGKLFDFREMNRWSWPWEDKPTPISYENVRQRSDLIVNEWRKKASLYKSNAILVPHGNDFRYITNDEWQAQRINLNRLFRFINNVGNYHVEVKFATLQDYFDFIHTRNESYPTLSGDFFTYSDEQQDYWSGYFTTRPYYKRMDRVLLHYLKGTEILTTLRGQLSSMNELTEIRRVHSLFQHHDGVTGTARVRVMEDYGRQMEHALNSCYEIITNNNNGYVLKDERLLGTGTFKYSLFNSLPFTRTETVEFHSWTPFVMVFDASNDPIFIQIVPEFDWIKQHRGIFVPGFGSMKKYKVILKVTVPSLDTTNFTIKIFGSNSTDYDKKHTQISDVVIYNSNRYTNLDEKKNHTFFQIKFKENQQFFITSHDLIEYHFNENGLLSHLITRNGTQFKMTVKFLKYLTHGPFQDKSGAYLFRPRGKASPLYDKRNVIIVTEGMYETRISAGFEFGVHEMIFRDSEIEVHNTIDIGQRDDTEIVMRVSTDINNENQEFFTDLNGFQLIKRKILPKIPLQANFYPIPSAIYIQDEKNRFTIVNGQPLGGSSLKIGQIEIMQDRRLTESDGRGLGEGVLDNRPIKNTFKFILEQQNEIKSKVNSRHPSGFHTNKSHYELQRLLFPLIKGIDLNFDEISIKNSNQNHFLYSNGLEIVLLKQLNANEIGLILHKTYLEGESEDFVLNVNLKSLLRLKSGQLFTSTVMLLTKNEPSHENFDITLSQMETKAVIIKNVEFMR